MAEYRDHFDEISALGAGIVALSVDAPEKSRALVDQLNLPFPLLCDVDHEVVTAYGRLNTKERGGIAFPTTFVLDRDRTVRFRSLDTLASRVNLDGLLAFLRAGITSAPPATPARSGVIPGIREWVRALGNAFRGGPRSPSK